MKRTPSGTAGRLTTCGCHEARATSSRPSDQPMSYQAGGWSVPSSDSTRYSESASQKLPMPAASSTQVRSRRQPVADSAPIDTPIRTRSVTG